MASQPLKDDEVQKQLKQMVSFILKEANEKAEEIKVKAEEEFNIERQRLVQAEKVKIIKDYERKEKQVEVQKKIAYSNELNGARLRTLKAREESIHRIIDEAYKKLSHVSTDPKRYREMIVLLIAQAAVKLNEPEATVVCREVDKSLVEAAIPEALQKLKAVSGQDMKLTVDTINHLAPPPVPGSDIAGCYGGILLSTHEGKIICSNTLEQRLSTVQEQLLPSCRGLLFGRSSTRKYFQ